MQTGDLIIRHDEGRGWSTVKILAIDRWPDGTETFHCLIYRPTLDRPTPEMTDTLDVMCYHVPVDGAGYRSDWDVLCSPGVRPNDLTGFVEYLKLTDYPRYAAFIGQDIKTLTGQAIEHYRAACALGDEGRREEAIAEYSRAIEVFPDFFEAIDNRAFTHMELGMLEPALAGFEESLRVNPDGNAAYFSRGECLMKLGQYDEAEQVFLQGAHKFPEHQNTYLQFLELNRRARTYKPNGIATTAPSTSEEHKTAEPMAPSVKRSWWRFWS
jgi:tetratricopeptide (TPR) repeat protein